MRDLKALKQKINVDIQPLKEMLSHRYDPMQKKQWLALIRRVKDSIVQNPEQYIEAESLPDHETLSNLVNDIFEDYVKRYIDNTSSL